ncbi:MAG: cobalamin-binding protein [Dehalococcoidia bacterium]|nr:cobalamin-binding protein [Dehalococcoidia bacterium]
MRKHALAFLTLLVIAGLLLSVACAAQTPPSEVTPTPPAEEKPPEEVEPPPPPEEEPAEPEEPAEVVEPEPEELPSFPLTITDDLDREVVIEKLPQRIISLAPSNTEILFALGLEDSIVGVTQYCSYPEAAKSKPRVAGYSTPDIEKVIYMQPDLVLTASIHEKTVLPALENAGLTVIAMSAISLDNVLEDITLVGYITGKSKTAAQLVDGLRARIEAVTAKTESLTPEERRKVLYVCWYDPITTMGSETFIDDLIQKAGGVNIFAEEFEKTRVVSLEEIIGRNPQVIVVSGMGVAATRTYNSIKTESRLSGVDAIVEGHIYEIDGNLIERSGPRIVDGLELVAKFIHPEIFGTPEAGS